ncbi:kinase-like protein [Clavulina sp. PMI_390]|nr:kinase-like protein [Clavulina sp. PMI_390]
MQLVGTARGIVYLHSRNPPIIHGDIHPGNILIDETGSPLLCDFGRSRIRHEVSRKSNREEGGRTRFLAPELSDDQGGHFSQTQESDVFALAMTFLNVWSREPPFPETGNWYQLITAVRNGERPARPTASVKLGSASHDEFWTLLVEMWAHEKAERPRSEKVLESVECIFRPLGHYFPSEATLLVTPFSDPGSEAAFHVVFLLLFFLTV